MTDLPAQDDQTTPEPKSSNKQATKPVGDQKEVGGPKGPEPTRFGDWEQKGRCTDF